MSDFVNLTVESGCLPSHSGEFVFEPGPTRINLDNVLSIKDHAGSSFLQTTTGGWIMVRESPKEIESKRLREHALDDLARAIGPQAEEIT